MASKLDLAYKHCQRIAKKRASNFYYAFLTLPLKKRKAIFATYAFCRICDDIADGDLPNERKKTLLDDTRLLLSESRIGNVANPVFTALSATAINFNIPNQYFVDIIDGVEMDLTWTQFHNFEELKTYCLRVASAVGLICIEVFGYCEPKAKEYAVDMGLAMQLTNIMRDIKEDVSRGRIYIPLDELTSFGYSTEEMTNGIYNDAFRKLMSFQAERARSYFANGQHLIPMLTPRSQACVAMLHQVYAKLLDRIEATCFNVFDERISLSQPEKLYMMTKLWMTSLSPFINQQKK